MLINNAIQILSQAYVKIGELGFSITKNIELGLEGNSTQNALWTKLIKSTIIYERLLQHVVLNDDGTKILTIQGLTTFEINELLFCLKESAGINNLPATPLPLRIYRVTYSSGVAGLPGADGEDVFIYIRYAQDSIGTNYSSTPSSIRKYVSILTSNIPLPDVVGTHTGNWYKYLGDDGVGIPGSAGTSQYIFQGWASDASGTAFTLIFNPVLKYTAFLTKTVNTSPLVAEFTGLWTKYIGENGTNGTNGINGNTIISNTIDPSSGNGVNGDYWINKATWTIFGPKAAGAWPIGVSLIGPVGAPGTNGLDGTNGVAGADGSSAYTYIAYANNASGTGYILVASNDDTAILSSFDSSKEWIGILISPVKIGGTIVYTDFNGIWAKYQGTGDRWTTSSTTSLTIGTGTKSLIVEENLAYSVGQTVVIAENSDFTKRMEGYVVSYNVGSGALIVSIANSFGSGTYTTWSVSLQAFLNDPPTTYGAASPSTVVVNDIPIGTVLTALTYDYLFEHIYAPYVSSAFSAFAISGQALIVEVGTTISGSKTFTWTTTTPINVATNTVIIRDETNATDLATGLADDSTEVVAITTVTKTSALSHTWRIKATKASPGSGTIQRDFTVAWQWKKHWGTSANVVLTGAQILSLANSDLDVDFAATVSYAAGDYKYFVFDDVLGSPTASTGFKDTATNLAITMADSTDNAAYSNTQNGWSYALVSVTNAQGVVSNKRVYRTRYTLGGTINIQVS